MKLFFLDTSFLHNLSTKSDLLKTADTNPCTDGEAKIADSNGTDRIERFLELHMKNIVFPIPPIKTAATAELKASADPNTFPVHLHVVKEMDKNELEALVRLVVFNFQLRMNLRINLRMRGLRTNHNLILSYSCLRGISLLNHRQNYYF